MKKILCALILFSLAGCDFGTESTPKVNEPKEIKTCLEYKEGQVPRGTYAQRQLTGEKVALDANGCFSFQTQSVQAARQLDEADSILFYNDSALFSLTIPFLNNGDTINIVPTIISLKNCPNSRIDSVFMVAYDKTNYLSRKVKMKRASYEDSSEYGRTLWSIENGSVFQIHYEIHEKNGFKWPSKVVTSEPGGTVTLDFNQVNGRSGLDLESIPDTLIFYTDSIMYLSDVQASPNKKYDFSKTSYSLRKNLIYGAASIKVNGVEQDTIHFDGVVDSFQYHPKTQVDSLLALPDTVLITNTRYNSQTRKYDTSITPVFNSMRALYSYNPPPVRAVEIEVVDSAGYSFTKTVQIYETNAVSPGPNMAVVGYITPSGYSHLLGIPYFIED